MVPSLFHISQALCVKLAPRITDVGDTPYHIIKPALRRLNSKQLSTLEENSPCIMPESDELWALLVEKEFPDRPFNTNQVKLLASGQDDDMPNRSLFRQYSEEKQVFLASSAQRLRRLTATLKKEKSKNSIVPIKGIVRDPSVRRRTPSRPRHSLASSSRPKSILGKARKDILERLLMFRSSPDSKNFSRNVRNPPHSTRARSSATPDLAAMNTSNPNGIYLQGRKRDVSQQSSHLVLSNLTPNLTLSNLNPSNLTPSFLHSNSRPAAPTQPTSSKSVTQLSRAKRPPSMFLNLRKKTRVAPTPVPPKESIYKEKPRQGPTLLKSPIKSSIFY